MVNKKIFILGVNGSPRKNGDTVKFLKRILKSAEKTGGKTLLIHLIEKNIKPCLGCYSISPKRCRFPCIQKDDMVEIYKLLLKSDGIVLGSPAYWYNVTGLMKNFLDRLSSLENNGFLLKGKVIGSVVSAEESGGEEASHYLVALMNDMGCLVPPFCAAYFQTKGGESWDLKDLENMGENIIKLCKALKKSKLTYPKFTSKV